MRRMAEQRHVVVSGGRSGAGGQLVLVRRWRRVLALDATLDAGPRIGVPLLLVLEPERAIVHAEHARRLAEPDPTDTHRLERALEVLLTLWVRGAAALGRRGGRLSERRGRRRGGRCAARPCRRRVSQLALHVHHAAHVHATRLAAAEARVRIARVCVLHHTPLTSWEERLMGFYTVDFTSVLAVFARNAGYRVPSTGAYRHETTQCVYIVREFVTGKRRETATAVPLST